MDSCAEIRMMLTYDNTHALYMHVRTHKQELNGIPISILDLASSKHSLISSSSEICTNINIYTIVRVLVMLWACV